MNRTETKSFTFKVAEKAGAKNKKDPLKVRDGVAIAGCTMTQTPWGREPTTSWFGAGGDGGMWC
jgi:hypothetical protein